MSEQAGQAADGAPRDSEETNVISGAPGPSGTGQQTTAGADPAAPSDDGATDGSPSNGGSSSSGESS